VGAGLLGQGDSHQRWDQAQMLRIVAQQDEQGISVWFGRVVLALTAAPYLLNWDAPEHSC
jgi:hypothetical protein